MGFIRVNFPTLQEIEIDTSTNMNQGRKMLLETAINFNFWYSHTKQSMDLIWKWNFYFHCILFHPFANIINNLEMEMSNFCFAIRKLFFISSSIPIKWWEQFIPFVSNKDTRVKLEAVKCNENAFSESAKSSLMKNSICLRRFPPLTQESTSIPCVPTSLL